MFTSRRHIIAKHSEAYLARGPRVLLYWHRYCTARSSGRQPNFVARYMYTVWNYATFVEGPTNIRLGGYYFGHWLTF